MKSRILFLVGVLVFLSAFVIRYEYIMHTEVIPPIRADARQYLHYGFNLFEYGVYSKQESGQDVSLKPDSYRSPGYPALIATAFFLGGTENFFSILLFFQVFLSSLIPLITLFLALRLLKPLWAVLVSVLVVLSPHLVSMCGYMLTETLFSFLIILSLWFFVEAQHRKNVLLFILSSVFWGLAYLTNETALFIPFSLALISGFLIWKRGASETFKPHWLIVFVLVFAIFPVSWATRNYMVVLEDSPQASSRALTTITHGSYIDFMHETEELRFFPFYEDPMQPAISNSLDMFLKVMHQRFQERPIEYLTWYLFKKPYYLWSWSFLQGYGDIYVYPVEKSLYTQYQFFDTIRVFFKLIHPVLMLFFLFGVIHIIFKILFYKNINILHQFTLATIGWIPVYYTFLYIIFAPWPRYSVPLRPLFFILSIYAIYTIFNFISNKFGMRLIKCTIASAGRDPRVKDASVSTKGSA